MLLKSLFTFLISFFVVATSATDQILDIIYVEGKEYMLPEINNKKMFMDVFANGTLIKEKGEDSFHFTMASRKDYQDERKVLIQLFTFDLEEVDAPKREPDNLLLEDGFPEELSKNLPMKYQDFFSLYHIYNNPRLLSSTALWRGYWTQWEIKTGKLYLTARLFPSDDNTEELKSRINGTELRYDDKVVYPPNPILADWYTNKLFVKTDFQWRKKLFNREEWETTYTIYDIKSGIVQNTTQCIIKQKAWKYLDHRKYCLN